ncbi:MAG: pilus assembly FimT family protein [Syntrophales bacterium]
MKNLKGKSRDRHTGESRYPELDKIAGFRVKPGMTKGGRYALLRVHQQGFTLIELLIVVSIIGIMMTVSLPISINMYYRYKASLQAQEVMVAISDLRRESFLYSENKVLSSDKNVLTVNGVAKNFAATSIRIDVPIQFYKNGTTSGGVINLIVSEYAYSIEIKAPFGDLALEGGLRAT